MQDLRPRLLAPRDAQGNPLTTKHRAGVVILVVSAVGMLATPSIPREAAVPATVFVAAVVLSFAGMRRRPPVATRTTALGPVTEVAVSRFLMLGGIAFVADVAGAAVLVTVHTAGSAPVVAVGAGLVAAAMLWLAVLKATAPDTRGVVHLSPLGISYSGPRFRAALAWDDVAGVLADEARMVLRIALAPGTPVVVSRNPGWPWRHRAGAPEVLSIAMYGMALLPTDLARVVVHYAAAPGCRSELGTDAALLRIDAVRAEPVTSYVTELDLAGAGGRVDVAVGGADAQPATAQRVLRLATVRENTTYAIGVLRVTVVSGAVLIAGGLAAVVGGWGSGYAVFRGAAYLVAGLIALTVGARATIRTRRAAAAAIAEPQRTARSG